MIISLQKNDLVQYVSKQLEFFFPDGLPTSDVARHVDKVFERMDHCLSAVHDRYFKGKDGSTCFNHLNSDHYAMFLYFLCNTLYREEADLRLCEKMFYLNKLLHGVDAFYSISLPFLKSPG